MRRIFCLGDSTTFGQHLRPEESYPQVLQALLDVRGWGFEVFNVALPGWSAHQELIAYRRICRKYAPDQVVVGICLNDVPEMQNNLSRPSGLVAWLYRRSAVVRRAVGAHRREIRGVRELFEARPPPEVRAGYERLFSSLRALRDEAGADHATLVIFVFPFRFQLAPDAPPPRPQEAIAAFCRSEQIPFLDVLPAFGQLGDAAFVDDDHPTAAGARRVAEEWIASGLVTGTPAEPGERGENLSAGALVAALTSPEAEERLRAAHALGNVHGGAAVVSALARRLSDESPVVRAAAARSLGQIASEARGAAPALVTALNDADEGVRLHAADALVRMHPDPKSCVPALVKILEDKGSPGRGAAARVVGTLGPAAQIAVPALAAALRDPSEEVRARSAWALGEIGPAAGVAVHALLDAMPDPHIRWRVVEALGRIDPAGRAAVPALTAALQDESGDVRRLAARSLGRIGKPAQAAGPELIACLADPQAGVRGAAARALSRVQPDPAAAAPALDRLLDDPDGDVRREAEGALKALGQK
jgi:HEAT repeat protein/lysophospholipase L1-like esterase